MDMLRRIMEKRMLPVCILMLLAIALMLPGVTRGDMPAVLDIIWGVVMVLWVCILVRCLYGFYRLQRKHADESRTAR